MNIRALAAQSLVPVLTQKGSLNTSLADNSNKVADKDLALFKELCFGVCRHYYSLEKLMSLMVSKPLKEKDSDIKALILIGLYQIRFLRIPDHAAINETVNGAKQLKKMWAVKMVNGVLRRFTREQDTLVSQIPREASLEHPPWLIKRVKKAWPDEWQSILQQNNQHPPLTLRTNAQQYSRDAYSDILSQEEIDHKVGTYSDHAITLSQATDVTKLPDFDKGSCSVQDEAAQLSAFLLDLAPGQRVLDACCAPGGKTCHIGESMPSLENLTAVDADEHRLARVKENIQRLNINAELICSEAQKLDQWWDSKPFDRILLDAPCSATGVIRRHPDIKLLRRHSDIAELSDLQKTLLQSLWEVLAPGGTLIYATCSILPDENEKIIQWFVEQQADAIHLSIEANWGQQRPFGRQLFPQENGHDGFYYAKLQKARNEK